MDDLARWLGEQLDVDAARAMGAAEEDGSGWRYDGRVVVTRRDGDLVAVGSQDFMELERGEHIAAHDPARVLREVDAKRRELALHQPEPGQHPDFCGYDRHELPCPSQRLLVLPYEDRPGYREEWRP